MSMEMKADGREPLWIAVYRGNEAIDRLVAASESHPVRTADGIQFTDSFGIHPARTEREYATPLTIEATVMTDSTNIGFIFAKGQIILNWDRREDLLRVKHPATGQAFNVPGLGFVPAGRWHHVEWIIAEDVMRLLVNGEERFALPGNYRGLKGKVGVHTGWRANLTVGSVSIREHLPASGVREGEPEADGSIRAVPGYHALPHASSFVGCLLGALRFYNRYVDEAVFAAGTGHSFHLRLGEDAGPEVQLDLVRGYGLDVTKRSGEEDAAEFVRSALAKGLPLFGKWAGEKQYRAIRSCNREGFRSEAPEAGIAAWSAAAGASDLELYAVRPAKEAEERERIIAVFRYAADVGASSAASAFGQWIAASSAPDAKPAELASAALNWSAKREDIVQLLRSVQVGQTGGNQAGLHEEAARLYEAARDKLREAAELAEASRKDAGGWRSRAAGCMEAARQAELEAARTLGRIAEALAGRKLLPGLVYQGDSCISHFNTLVGVARYYGIDASDSWIRGATGRPFLMAVHPEVNVHDHCLALPEHKMIELFAAGLGLELGSVQGDVRGEARLALLREAWDAARAAIDAGWAVFGRSVDQPGGEYALIVGYDQDGYYSHSWHGRAGSAIPWPQLGRGVCPCEPCTRRRNDWKREGPVKTPCRCQACRRLQATGPFLPPEEAGDIRLYWAKPGKPAEDHSVVSGALRLAVEFAAPDGPWVQPDLRTGAEAYDVWIRALEKGIVDGWYLGLYANAWRELRYHAGQFLSEAKERLAAMLPHSASAFDDAIRQAQKLNEIFTKLNEMFPWMQPFGPIPDKERRYAGAELLRKGRQAELDAIESYTRLLEHLEG
ncbi:LamG domain-containing protein [Paenibacillus hamazuiensis]|uniref:LamG domain-containing protein n=1 Tax=Paenibacillus hamazuiensis TaxID=2936508 RepID=UPI00200F1599|nr:LamG domain-containing protein [Paenibacillus hamazuiensis]